MEPKAQPQIDEPGRRRALIFIILTVFIDLLGVGVLMPVIPYLTARFRDDALTVGALSLAFSAAQFLALPVLGGMSDRLGRRAILLISLFGSGVGYVLFGVGGALWVLFLSRILDGATGGNISVAQAYIADISRQEDRAKNMGLIGAAFGIGFIIGPALGGVLSHISLETPAWAAAALCFANVAFGLFYLPESLPPERRKRTPLRLADWNPMRAVLRALVPPELRMLMLGSFAFSMAMGGMQSNFAVLTLKRFHYGPDDNAVVFAYLGLMAALGQGLLVRWAVPRTGEVQAARIGLALDVLGFAAIAYAPSPVWIYLSMTLTAMGNGLLGPTLTSLIAQRARAGEQGEVLGANQAIASLGRIAGPLIAGWTFDHISTGAPYWLGAASLAVGLFLLRREERYTASHA